jgi:hypothetical protein
MIKDITLQFIDGEDQRYNTHGDYWEEPYALQVRITEYRNDQYAHLAAIHKMVEMLLVKHRGVSAKFTHVEEFNMMYVDEGQPGSDPAAPHHREHTFAERITKLCAEELGVDWSAYTHAVEHGEPVPVYDDYDEKIGYGDYDG